MSDTMDTVNQNVDKKRKFKKIIYLMQQYLNMEEQSRSLQKSVKRLAHNGTTDNSRTMLIILLRFRDISIHFPGSAHDAAVFKESGLYRKGQMIIPKLFINYGETQAPMVIAGDAAYPLLDWLLKPYTDNLTAQEESFKCYLAFE